jgi:hypothetical protein
MGVRGRTIFNRLQRRWFPKRYALRKLREQEDENRRKIKAAGSSLTAIEKYNLESELNHDLFEWIDWIQEIDDQKSVARARKMDIYLDDIPPSPSEDKIYDDGPHHTFSGGHRLLRPASRAALMAKIHERNPAYKRERREVIELWIKIGTLALALLTGLIGAATGFVALWWKSR